MSRHSSSRPEAISNTDATSQPPPAGYGHLPVLREETLRFLQPESGKTYADATLGAGGHAEAVLEACAPDGRLFGVDQDPVALQIAGERLAQFSGRFQAIRGNFSCLPSLLPTDCRVLSGGVVADLGVSSMQLDTGERGFSFSRNAPLDMRMSADLTLTAAEVINRYPESELQRIFSEYGEEHLAATLAQGIAQRRMDKPFETTTELADWIAAIYKSRGKREKIHPATRVFQAVRIEVNDELGHLQRFLEQLPALLAPGARVAIITFHSLEDRLVKRFFQRESSACLCPPNFPVCCCGHSPTLQVLTPKPVQASPEETRNNPRARSAKLRAAMRL